MSHPTDAQAAGAPTTADRSTEEAMTRISPRARTVVVALALVLAVRDAAAQGLSTVEREIAAHVDATFEDAVALLERIVNINSGTMNRAGNEAVADVLAVEFEALGFDVRWSPLPDSLNRSGHLIAERTGNRGKRVLLIGHLDTVFEEDSPFQRFERDGDVAAGPGVADMKGGDVVILQALRALDAVGALEDATIRVILTGDEESPGEPLEVARRELIELAKRSDVALGFEGGSRDGAVEYGVVARRSSSDWRLRVTGRRAHSSGVFSRGVGAGAIFEAARILHRFYEEVRGEEYLTFNPGVILGGTDVEIDYGVSGGTAFGKTNVVAQTVVVSGGIRTISREQLERARAKMRAIVAESLPGTSAEIEFFDGYPSMPPTEGNRALLAVLDDVSRDLGYGRIVPFDPGGRGAADVSFAAPHVDAALDGLGPYGTGSHTTEETVDLRSMTKAAKRAAVLIYRLTRGDEVL
ncbi:MAG TPA: M20/M25/M40 family metallo-hydrolase [Longimicrobiales bacterium]